MVGVTYAQPSDASGHRGRGSFRISLRRKRWKISNGNINRHSLSWIQPSRESFPVKDDRGRKGYLSPPRERVPNLSDGYWKGA